MHCSLIVFLAALVIIGDVQAEAKIEARPLEAEQNFRLLRKNILDQNDLELEGSGEELLDDDDEYEDDDYYDDDEYDTDDFGSGFGSEDYDQDLIVDQAPQVPTKIIPDETEEKDDFHFEDTKDTSEPKPKNTYEDLLYEYYTELQFGDDDDDLDYLDEVEQDLNEEVTKIKEQDLDAKSAPNALFQPSYIFLMLTSALFSFAVFILAFVLCRKSASRRQKKSQMVPFVVSTHDFSTVSKSSSPIVKNYQRVPTSTKEMIMQQQTTLEKVISETQKPLLT